MAKDYKIKYLKRLLEQLSIQSGESLDHYGTVRLSEKIQGSITQKYLYDNLLRPVQKAQHEDDILKLSPNKIDEIARHLGYNNFESFQSDLEKNTGTVLVSLIGNYYSYVRKNARETTLLQSPVKIYEEENNIKILLKGPQYSFIGDLIYKNGCLFCLMECPESGKSFHHIYKIGKSISPSVLMGIFSGISSSNDPIGGRCILVKRDENFDDLINCKISWNEIFQDKNKKMLKLASYFEKYEENNIRINTPYAFDFDDLIS